MQVRNINIGCRRVEVAAAVVLSAGRVVGIEAAVAAVGRLAKRAAVEGVAKLEVVSAVKADIVRIAGVRRWKRAAGAAGTVPAAVPRRPNVAVAVPSFSRQIAPEKSAQA